MSIAVSVSGNDLDAQVDPRFGRARGFLIVEPESMEFEYLDNPNIDAPGGAGIQTGQMIANRGVEAVVTGNVGPNAYRVLETANVKIFTGATGSAREAVEAYKAGKLSSAGSANVDEYFGMGGRGGGGGGGGRGGGMGMGRGGGMGGGGRGRGGGGGGGGGRRW